MGRAVRRDRLGHVDEVEEVDRWTELGGGGGMDMSVRYILVKSSP